MAHIFLNFDKRNEICPYFLQMKKCFVYFNKIGKMIQYIISMEFYKENSQ